MKCNLFINVIEFYCKSNYFFLLINTTLAMNDRRNWSSFEWVKAPSEKWPCRFIGQYKKYKKQASSG